MMSDQLAKNFRRGEFACQCGCGFADISMELVGELQRLRDHLGIGISILSGCRCAKHNAAVGGAAHSQHVLGRAADIRIWSLNARQMYAVAAGLVGFGGLGVDDERGFLHVDVRVGPQVRWCYQGGREIAWFENPDLELERAADVRGGGGAGGLRRARCGR
jgi:uncharacterized protein YcbK (DUF882 family)